MGNRIIWSQKDCSDQQHQNQAHIRLMQIEQALASAETTCLLSGMKKEECGGCGQANHDLTVARLVNELLLEQQEIKSFLPKKSPEKVA